MYRSTTVWFLSSDNSFIGKLIFRLGIFCSVVSTPFDLKCAAKKNENLTSDKHFRQKHFWIGFIYVDREDNLCSQNFEILTKPIHDIEFWFQDIILWWMVMDSVTLGCNNYIYIFFKFFRKIITSLGDIFFLQKTIKNSFAHKIISTRHIFKSFAAPVTFKSSANFWTEKIFNLEIIYEYFPKCCYLN